MFPSPLLGKVLVSPVQYWKRFYVPKSKLGKDSIGSPVHYWVKVLCVLKSNARKGCRFPSAVMGKGSIGSPDQYWDGFYKFPSPLLDNVL